MIQNHQQVVTELVIAESIFLFMQKGVNKDFMNAAILRAIYWIGL